MNLHHHDPATLFAGKLHAILQRNYLKGRDIFDLWWYLSQEDWPEPNFDHLNQNLQQGGWGGEPLTAANWQTVVREKIRQLQWPLVLEDVAPFIIDADELRDFNKTRLLTLLDSP